MKKWMILTAALCLTALCAAVMADAAEEFGVEELVPQAGTPAPEKLEAELYSGPTAQFLRDGDAVLNLSQPYVYFGQYDCWAMAAAGTPDSFGPVGWVEAASIPEMPYDPQLGFDERLTVTAEEDTFLTEEPCSDAPRELMTLAAGESVSLLAVWKDWGYVQYEGGEKPVRAFLPLDAVR